MCIRDRCYSERVNIPFVNKVIIPGLFYNNAAMSQYYGRFIRFDSKEMTDVYFMNYQRSIEAKDVYKRQFYGRGVEKIFSDVQRM